MEKYPNAWKVDTDAMGGKVVECEIDRIMQCAIELGVELDMQQSIEQWVQQLIRRSFEIGIEQGHVQLIENLLNKNKTPTEIAEFCDFEIQEVENIQKKMLANI